MLENKLTKIKKKETDAMKKSLERWLPLWLLLLDADACSARYPSAEVQVNGER